MEVRIGAAASLFYGLFAVRIFRAKPPEEHKRLWYVHQFWFNLVGSLTGCGAGYCLWRKMETCHTPVVGTTEILLMVVAILGITGHLPLTVYGIAASIGGVAMRMEEWLIGRLDPRRTGAPGDSDRRDGK